MNEETAKRKAIQAIKMVGMELSVVGLELFDPEEIDYEQGIIDFSIGNRLMRIVIEDHGEQGK